MGRKNAIIYYIKNIIMDLEIAWTIIFVLHLFLSVIWHNIYFRFTNQSWKDIVIDFIVLVFFAFVLFCISAFIGLVLFIPWAETFYGMLSLEIIWGITLISALTYFVMQFKTLFLELKENVTEKIAKKAYLKIIFLDILSALILIPFFI